MPHRITLKVSNKIIMPIILREILAELKQIMNAKSMISNMNLPDNNNQSSITQDNRNIGHALKHDITKSKG